MRTGEVGQCIGVEAGGGTGDTEPGAGEGEVCVGKETREADAEVREGSVLHRIQTDIRHRMYLVRYSWS